MLISPKYLVENEIITFPEHIIVSEHIQQNGIDIDCLELTHLSYTTTPAIFKDSSHKPNPVLLTPTEITKSGIQGWLLKKGEAYSFNSSFEINIPKNMGGQVVGRSTFNRQGLLIRSSWFDSGFKGTLGATIYCFNDCFIETGVRIGQFIMHSGESAGLYAGQYQKK